METIIENVKEMLSNRGDDLTSFIDMEQNYIKKDFYTKTLQTYPHFYTDKTCVIVCILQEYRKNLFDEIKSKQKPLEETVHNFIENHNNKLNYIVILSNTKKLTTIDKGILSQFDKQIQKQGGIFQDFYDNTFMFNPLKHELVPPHRKLSITEVKEVMEKYMINSKTNFPYILKNDVIAKWLGLKTGDIVEIKHYNPNSGLTYYYRCCM
jgi:DNA-directed RNA polymerase subunit H (RpoH/RPB5)